MKYEEETTNDGPRASRRGAAKPIGTGLAGRNLVPSLHASGQRLGAFMTLCVLVSVICHSCAIFFKLGSYVFSSTQWVPLRNGHSTLSVHVCMIRSHQYESHQDAEYRQISLRVMHIRHNRPLHVGYLPEAKVNKVTSYSEGLRINRRSKARNISLLHNPILPIS